MARNNTEVLILDASDSNINPGFERAWEAHLLCGWHWPAGRGGCLRLRHHSLRSDTPASFVQYPHSCLAGKEAMVLASACKLHALLSMNLVSNLRSRNRYRANREHLGILLLRRYEPHLT